MVVGKFGWSYVWAAYWRTAAGAGKVVAQKMMVTGMPCDDLFSKKVMIEVWR